MLSSALHTFPSLLFIPSLFSVHIHLCDKKEDPSFPLRVKVTDSHLHGKIRFLRIGRTVVKVHPLSCVSRDRSCCVTLHLERVYFPKDDICLLIYVKAETWKDPCMCATSISFFSISLFFFWASKRTKNCNAMCPGASSGTVIHVGNCN